MKVYLKIHSNGEIDTVAVCDESLLNECFIEGDLKITISKQFYGGKLMEIQDAVEILKKSSFFNIVGEDIIDSAVNCNIIPKEGVRFINGIPMAIKMMF